MAKAKKTAAARDEALEAAIAEDVTRPEPWRVYSDWLQQQGDPRGELIAVQSALGAAKGPEWGRLKIRELELLEAHAEHFYGPLKRYRAARRDDVGWRNGYLRKVVGHTLQPAVMELFVHPSARFLDKVLVDDGDLLNVHPFQPFTEVIVTQEKIDAALALPKLRRLSIGLFSRFDGTLDHPGLARLWVGRIGSEQLKRLAASALPALTHLSFAPGSNALEEAAELIVAKPLERLRVQLFGVQEGQPALAPEAARRITDLSLDETPARWLQGPFERVARLDASAPSGPQRDTFFQQLGPLPALRRVRLATPDLVGWFRSFATSTAAEQVEHLEVSVAKPAPGRALTEGRYPKLKRLVLRFDATLSPEFLESATVLAAPAWSEVRALELTPMRQFSVLVASPLAQQLEELTVELESDREGELLLAHVGKLPRLKRLRVRGERVDSADVLTRLAALPLELEWLGTHTESIWD